MSSEDATTKPTIETVLERINDLKESVNARFSNMENNMNARFEALEESMNIRLDRISSLAHLTRSEMLGMRADFTELRKELREQISALR